MPMLSIKSRIGKSVEPLAGARWITLALPLTVAAGCSGLQNRDIIDYTVSEAEYLALTAPQTPEFTRDTEMLAAQENNAPADNTSPVTNQITLAAAPPLPEQAPATMPTTPSITASEAAAAAMVEPVAALQPPVAEEPEIAAALPRPAAIDYDTLDFSPSIYASAGLGVSRLNPDTSAAPGWTADDKVAGAGQVSLGVDIARHLSVELHSADYGSAGLAPEGRVNYHMNGLSALLYAGKDKYRRGGWNGYARIGYNQIENTPVGNVPFIEQTSEHASFGLGAEYNTRYGLGFRGDVIAYDGDVQSAQLGMLYRMAKKPKRPLLAAAPELPSQPVTEVPALQAAMPKPTTPPAPEIEAPVVAPAPQAAPDALSDDIMLPAIAAQPPAQDECAQLNGTINNVSFQNGSSSLTQGASIALNDVARTLTDCPDRQIVVSAHTDNSGSAAANNELSKIRARNVAIYLARQGVDMDRMRAVAYGESRPVASNATVDGRMRNRRVELEVR